MVESGPFIEYCCELYIHHDVLNIAVAVTILVCVLVSVEFALGITRLKKLFIWLDKKYFDELSNKEHRESLGALSPRDCEDVTCNDQGKENL